MRCDRLEWQPEGHRTRVYRYEPPTDGREQVFQVWQQREADFMQPSARFWLRVSEWRRRMIQKSSG